MPNDMHVQRQQRITLHNQCQQPTNRSAMIFQVYKHNLWFNQFFLFSPFSLYIGQSRQIYIMLFKKRNKLANNNEKNATEMSIPPSNRTNTTINGSTTTKKKQKVSIIRLFQFSTFNERILLVIAFLCSICAGALQPVSIVIYGRLISDLTTQMYEDARDDAKIRDIVLEMVKIILYIGLAAMVSAYISTCLWIRTGESQTRRIRMKYLHSLLHQDMEWYDKMGHQNSLSSRLTSDTQFIQDGISENFGMLVANMSQFFAGIIVAFIKGNI